MAKSKFKLPPNPF